MPSLETETNRRTYKSARIVQMFGLTGRTLSEGDNQLIEELADMAPTNGENEMATANLDQPLAAISIGKLARARQIVMLLPETVGTIDYLRSTSDGNPHWTSI